MDKTTSRKIEQQLYQYFRRVRQLERFEWRLVKTREKIAGIEKDIQECNHRIENPLRSPSFDGMPKDSCVNSAIENALIQSYERMEKELAALYNRQANLIVTISRISDEVEVVGLIIGDLDEADKRMIDLRYNQRYTFRDMEGLLFMDHVSLHRQKDRVFQWMAGEMVEIEDAV